MQIRPPVYLVSKTIACWKCREDMPAVAIIAPNVFKEDGQVCILSNIQSLPENLLMFIKKRFPSFKLKYSSITQSEYFANICIKCGKLSGDFYLHSEPGGPFFPMTEEEAQCLTVEQIPIDAPIEIEAGFHIGAGDLILEHGKKDTAEY